MTRNLGACIDPAAEDARLALVLTDGIRTLATLTYGDVRQRVAAQARAIAAITAPGAAIGLLAGNDTDHFLAFQAVMYAGRCAVPINWKLPAATIAHIAADAGLSAVIVADTMASLVPPGVMRLSLATLAQAADHVPPFAATQPLDEDLACIMYTSGSTGRPKGVPLTHRGYLWGIHQYAPHAGSVRKTISLVAAPLYHMNAQCTLLLQLAYGGAAVILERFEIDAFVGAIGRFAITEITGVPTMLAMALNRMDEGLEADLSSVDTIAIGSAPLSERLIARIRAAFPRARIDNGYGTTETGFIAFGGHPDGTRTRPPLSLGYPHPAVGMRLVGPDAPNSGELWLRTGMMAKGYLNQPEATAEKFVDGWYRTGDIVRRDALGFHYFVERTDDMFVCGGVNIHPAEVEALLETHPAVAQAAVIGMPDEIKGAVPVAFVVRTPGAAAVDEVELKAHAIAGGPAYAHPRRVFFCEALPLAGTNKVDRQALRATALEQQP